MRVPNAFPAFGEDTTRREALARLGLAATSLLACGAEAPPPVRIALVIGNGAYAYSDPLPNAPRDARRLSDKLASLGFQVEPRTLDLDRGGLDRTIAAFGAKLRAAGPNVIGFFYYAGHAAQDAFGVNYLLPVDAKARNPAELRGEGLAMQRLLQAMEDSNNAINIVVLDACRDWYKGDRKPQDPTGLHDMGQHASMLIAYAARPGDTADEGAGGDSSPFSRRLIEALGRQSRDPIVLLLDDVKSLVYQDTDSLQSPLIVDGLTVSGRWALASGALAEVKDKPQPTGAGTPISAFLAGLDRRKLVTFFRGQESLADTMLARRDVLEKYAINRPLRLAHFLAQIGYESGGFRVKEEKFGYSAQRLRQLFPSRVTSDETAQRIAGHPEQVANVIYARKELGNGPPESGDGWRYRGRGIFGLFITGRYNYRKFGEMVGVDLIASPDLANDPEIALALSAAVWTSMRVNAAADADDLAAVTRRLSGAGATDPGALAARGTWLAQAKSAVAAGR